MNILSLRERVFESQNVHGIVTYAVSQHKQLSTSYGLIVWGGHMLRTCTLTFERESQSSLDSGIRLEADPARNLNDWIMTLTIDNGNSKAVLLTAHNTLKIVPLRKWDVTATSIMTISGVETLLYSGHISIIDDTRILVASGTVFGEVLVWTCFKPLQSDLWIGQTKRVFLGHRGSIFGVAISGSFNFAHKSRRLLASCSDDRTIRVWDISDIENEVPNSQTNGDHATDTGFGAEADQNLHLCMAWGHLSRIWEVHFENLQNDENKTDISLVTRGEDGACNHWNLWLDKTFHGNTECSALRLVSGDRLHSGKNVWSLAEGPQLESLQVLTGGADGQVIARIFGSGFVAHKCARFRDMTVESKKGSVKAIKQYLVFRDGSIVATADSGTVLHGRSRDVHNWSTIFEPLKPMTTTLCSNSANDLALWHTFTGTLFIFDTLSCSISSVSASAGLELSWMQVAHSSTNSDGVHEIYLFLGMRQHIRSKLIKVTYKGKILETQVLELHMPSEFVTTSTCYRPKRQILICGSRAGAVAIFDKITLSEAEHKACICVRHVHGSDCVTSIMPLPYVSEHPIPKHLYVLTTGRDGTFAIHMLIPESGLQGSVRFETVHTATLPIGPYIEGAYIEHDDAGNDSLFIYGFKSTEFVVWNESHQMQRMSVHCGGAHRSWNYHADVGGTQLYVWTKAGAVNAIQTPRESHHVLQHGGHGREMKSLAVTRSSRLLDHDNTSSELATIIATGAEDTTVRLFEYTPNSITCVAIIRHHLTGPQALRFSACGQYLFSSGGAEEFMVWRLSKVPVVKIGTVAIGQLPQSEDEDARIMEFDIIELSPRETQVPRFLIVMAYSTGKAKVVEYIPSTSAPGQGFKTLQILNIGTLCLTQAIFLHSGTMLSALIGSTDGFLRFSHVDDVSEAIVSHRVHQSNVAGMATHRITTDCYLVATGGDDNALGLTLLQTSKHEAKFQTMLIPKAHAAALTSVGIFAVPTGNSILIVSAGNDQKVKLWHLTTCLGGQELLSSSSSPVRPQLSDVRVQKAAEIWTDVADVSNLEILGMVGAAATGRFLEVLIVGVGMQSVGFEIGKSLD